MILSGDIDTLDRHTFIIDQLRKSSNVATSIQRKISTKAQSVYYDRLTKESLEAFETGKFNLNEKRLECSRNRGQHTLAIMNVNCVIFSVCLFE